MVCSVKCLLKLDECFVNAVQSVCSGEEILRALLSFRLVFFFAEMGHNSLRVMKSIC